MNWRVLSFTGKRCVVHIEPCRHELARVALNRRRPQSVYRLSSRVATNRRASSFSVGGVSSSTQ